VADTENVFHLSALVIVPLLIGVITWVSNVSTAVSFLVYPPLASGTYTLFADPGGRYSSARRFVGGMTVGAFSGWLALEASAQFWYSVPPAQFQVHTGAAALGIFLTGALTWVLGLEEPTAFSSALLVLVTGSEQLTYVVGIAVSSLLVAGVFVLWRREFYHERDRFLFQSAREHSRVLVPVRGTDPEPFVLFAARLAAARETGTVVLLDTVTPAAIAEAASELDLDTVGSTVAVESAAEDSSRAAEEAITDERLDRLEALQRRIEAVVDVPCEFVVAVEDGGTAETVHRTAETAACDLIVAPYETDDGAPTRFVRDVLYGDTDAVVFRSSTDRTEWPRVLTVVSSPGELANTMLDFARRLAGDAGTISACTCISRDRDRRTAEIMLENIVETVGTSIETRIAHGSLEDFVRRNAAHYDLTVVGASDDPSVTSWVVSPPTFEHVDDAECDLAVVHRD